MAAAIRRASVFNGSAPGSNTDIFTDSLSPKRGCVYARLTTVFSTTTVVNVTASDGTTTHAMKLGATVAGEVNVFEFSVDPALTYNVQIVTDSVIETLLWDDLLERV